MDKRTKGAWLIHHTKKLLEFKDATEFEEIELAGKCGTFLSNLAASDEQSDLNGEKVAAIAKVSNIKKTEIETIQNRLKDAQLIDVSKTGAVSVLGITTSSVLGHTADIFAGTKPNNYQEAALSLSEKISDLPKGENSLREYISDSHKLSKNEVNDLLLQSEEVGFVDYEKLDDSSKFYFNGNLFRKDVVKKTNAILGSLKAEDIKKVNDVDSLLTSKGCLTLEKVKTMLGEQLLSKLMSIAMYDLNEVSNAMETQVFVTKPSAFSKFGNPFEEDALDLAKAFVSSLYYGMNFSSQGRGKIGFLKALMRKLINGVEVGPATAIGEDYRILELKRVIQLRKEGTTSMYHMRLLKRDIGILALQVLESGDAAEQSVLTPVYSGSVTDYKGPEQKRYAVRKKQATQTKKSVADLIRTFRS
ncbi:MAG: hypothetical protein JNM57_10775 [Cyclobacteriaceae bacterium]|nr:hypothetical protein [Cyclobacteriaceae bacterium]